jgi:hypothetical protein
MAGVITVPLMQKALLIVADTNKAHHLWNSNHHGGLGQMGGYPKKMADTYYQDVSRLWPIPRHIYGTRTTMEDWGKWADTLKGS